MIGETVWTVIKWFGDYSEGEASCLKVFSTYEKAREFCEGYYNWDPEFNSEPDSDTWSTEYFMLDIEEQTVE